MAEFIPFMVEYVPLEPYSIHDDAAWAKFKEGQVERFTETKALLDCDNITTMCMTVLPRFGTIDCLTPDPNWPE